jgi:hypothetical protein
VTIAFGSRNRVLLPLMARRRAELPEQTRWQKIPGCGHIPMFDDPGAVAALLTESSQLGATDLESLPLTGQPGQPFRRCHPPFTLVGDQGRRPGPGRGVEQA